MPTDPHPRMVALCAMEIETLRGIHDKGPTWDGDVLSKSCRDTLVSKGLVVKMLVRGAEGHQACTYYGREVLDAIGAEFSERKP